ncbi:MAG: hypothetical protein VKK98_05685 [Cyanobacteriota bacterium]|nr:hypothetical protein [Cyanobacteriota bacterium]
MLQCASGQALLIQATALGLYDGHRLFRIGQPSGGRLTLTLSCEREQWRVQSRVSPEGQPSFYDSRFLSAKGIS